MCGFWATADYDGDLKHRNEYAVAWGFLAMMYVSMVVVELWFYKDVEKVVETKNYDHGGMAAHDELGRPEGDPNAVNP